MLAVAVGMAAAVAGGRAEANGGWTDYFFDAESGPVYSGTEHPAIALEKEVLVLEGFDGDGSPWTSVHYEFANTSYEDVVVEAAFPVDIRIELEDDGEHMIIAGHAKGEEGGAERLLGFARAVLGKSLKVSYDGDMGRYVGRILRKDVERDETVGRKEFEKRFGEHVEFRIDQDGAPLDVPLVAIRTRIVAGPSHDELGILGLEEAEYLSVTIHFGYVKKFAAGARSHVDARFKVPGLSTRASYGQTMSEYSWYYRLGPGGTWKGPIDVLWVVVPEEVGDGLVWQEGESIEDMGQAGSMHLFLARDYEPVVGIGEDDDWYDQNVLYAYWGVVDDEGLMDHMIETEHPEAPPKEPWLDFVKPGQASSVSTEKADVYSPGWILEGAGFGPLSVIDGIDETAWCTMPGKAVGEWVEIAIDKDVLGLTVVNGFQQTAGKIAGPGCHKSFGRENRVKTLEIVSDEGEVLRTLELEDETGDQDFLDVELPAGTYRLRVAAIFEGKKKAAARTCLGEFVPYPDNEVLHSDPFLAKWVLAGG